SCRLLSEVEGKRHVLGTGSSQLALARISRRHHTAFTARCAAYGHDRPEWTEHLDPGALHRTSCSGGVRKSKITSAPAEGPEERRGRLYNPLGAKDISVFSRHRPPLAYRPLQTDGESMVDKPRSPDAPARRRVDVLGGCRIDGVPVSSARAVELVVALAVSGGSAPRDWLLSVLFDADPAPSSLPTLALRARTLGLTVEYRPDRHSYALMTPVECDLAEFFKEMKSGDPRRALSLYHGPF